MKLKRILSTVLTLLLMLSTIFSINVFALETATIKEGTYTIQSKLGSNMVLDVDDASKKSGANIQLYKSNGSTAQQFEIKKSGSYYTITPKCSGLKVDVKGGSTEAGANVWQYTSNNSNSQKWQFYNAGNGYYYIRCKIGDKALDVSGGKSSNGTNIQMHTLNQSDAQKWKLVPVKESSYQKKVNEFITNKKWKNNIKWTASQKPKKSTYSASGCCAYAVDFCKYVFNKNSYRSGTKFTKVKDIKTGDIIHVKNSSHWFVVLERDGNKLKTAEGNWMGKVVVSDSIYSINNNKIYRNGKYFRAMEAGYHMQ